MLCFYFFLFFVFKQKTAYEMRISDWSSDVCSSDLHRYRLGVNSHQIPVNAPRCPVHNFHRDGAMRVDGNAGATLAYVPNSANEWADRPDFSEPPLAIRGDADHWDQIGRAHV